MKKLIALLLIVFALNIATKAENKPLSQQEVEDIIETNFLLGEIPKRYYSNILVQITGNPTSDDILYTRKLVKQLKPLISKWEIDVVTTGKANNLILNINGGKATNRASNYRDRKYEILFRKIDLQALTPEIGKDKRKQIIRHRLLTALLQSTSSYKLKERIPGSVFAEQADDNITFHPADFQIIQAAYSMKYEEMYERILKEKPDARTMNGADVQRNYSKNILAPTVQKYKYIFVAITNLIAVIISIALFTFFLQKGYFKPHNYKFLSFFKQGLLILAIFIIMALCFYFVLILQISGFFDVKRQIIRPAIAGFTGVFIIGILSIILIFFSEKKILRNNSYLILDVLFPMITTSVIPSLIILIFYLTFTSKSGSTVTPIDVSSVLLNFIAFFSVFGFVRSLYIYLFKKSEQIIHKKDVELARIGELHKQAELQSLRSKINPHFLYNSLNSIASLASIDAERTEEMALALSDFFKYSINREQKQMNPIREELKATETYLQIEKVRFGDRLNYAIDCAEELLDCPIPQMLIQPLVENAIKHGISKLVENGKLKIEIRAVEDRKICIRIFDNGPEFPTGPLSGFGIRNTYERLRLLYKKQAKVNWVNSPEKYIELLIPFKI